jgi:hypothetical protein
VFGFVAERAFMPRVVMESIPHPDFRDVARV